VGLISDRHPLLIVVGSGGVGKTTLAAALGVLSARSGRDTLVMTFDPSLRLKDALGVGEEARDHEIPVPLDPPTGSLSASLLDARRTFDRLVERYAPDEPARRRILENRFYQHLSGALGGVLEYMAVERLFEVAAEGRYRQVILDTPPTRQALDFLEAPERILGFLDSGALRLALKDWFDAEGRLRASRWGVLGRRAERFLDDVVGLDLLRDMAEFFQAFGPLYEGFRERAQGVEQLLRSPKTRFVLVAGPGEERIPDTLFFARRLEQAGYHLGPIIVNRVHPRFQMDGAAPTAAATGGGDPLRPTGWELLTWLGERDRRGLVELATLLERDQPLLDLPLLPAEPTDLASLEALGRTVEERLTEWEMYVSRSS